VSGSDADVVRDVRGGNRDAFGELVRRYQGRLFGLVLMMARERAGAEELTQDAFVRAYAHLSHFDLGRPFYPWLATIAVRLAQNWLRSRDRQSHREARARDATPDVDASSPLSALIAGESSRRLWSAVAALSYGERTAVFLHYRDAMSVTEIARALGVSDGTIKTLLFRARRRLRERLQADADVALESRS
jgi:RNA polymerase sigma-70 factor (ECF subfamily)